MLRLRFSWLLVIGLLVLIGSLLTQDPTSAYGLTVCIMAGTVIPVLALIEWLLFRKKGPTTLSVLSMLLIFSSAAIGLIWLLSFLNPIVLSIAVALLAAITGTLLFLRQDSLKSHREVSGRCTYCGYDLRASVERCPECGKDLPEEISRRRRIALELASKNSGGTNGPPPQSPKPSSSTTASQSSG